MILRLISVKEISEHIFDEGPDSIDFAGIIQKFRNTNIKSLIFLFLKLNQWSIHVILILQLGTGSISSGSAKSVHSTSIATRTDSRLDDSLNESSISTLSTSYPGRH